MVSYVADDLEDKLRISSKEKARQGFLNEMSKSKDYYQPDIMLLEDIETEGSYYVLFIIIYH